jgi:hypothetical protein
MGNVCGGGGASLEKRRSSLEDHSPLGAYLSAEELLELAKVCESMSFRQGVALPESPFYVVISGQVEVRDPNGNVLCTKYPGSFFTRRAGLVAQTKQGKKTGGELPADAAAVQRSSIVKADLEDGESDLDSAPLTSIVGGKVGGTVVFVRSDKFEVYIHKDCSHASAEVCNSITRTNIGTQLSQVPFIKQADLEPTGLRALGEICSYATYPAKKVIFKQGDPAENFYILLKGSVDITINVKALRGTGDEEVKAGTRGVGDSFGVAALVYNAAERKYSTTTTGAPPPAPSPPTNALWFRCSVPPRAHRRHRHHL